jgi:hypothetical protein
MVLSELAMLVLAKPVVSRGWQAAHRCSDDQAESGISSSTQQYRQLGPNGGELRAFSIVRLP